MNQVVNKYPLSTTSLTSATTLIGPNNPLKVPAPIVWYGPGILESIKYVIAKCTQEVGWWGTVERIGNDFLVNKLFVPLQEVHGTETDITADTMAAMMEEIMAANGDPSTLYYWGHSHVNMGVSPSGQDEDQVAEYLETGMPFFIRGIYNKAGAAKVDVYDTERGICHQAVQHGTPNYGLDKSVTEGLDKLIASNVKKYIAPVAPYQGYNHGHYQGQNLKNWESPATKIPGNVAPIKERTFVMGKQALAYLSNPHGNVLDDPLDDSFDDGVGDTDAWAALNISLREE